MVWDGGGGKGSEAMSIIYVILRAPCSTSRCNFRTRKTSLISSHKAAKVGRISSIAKGWGIWHLYNYDTCITAVQRLTAAFGALRTAKHDVLRTCEFQLLASVPCFLLTFPLLFNCKQKVVSQSSTSSLQREFHLVAFGVQYQRRFSV